MQVIIIITIINLFFGKVNQKERFILEDFSTRYPQEHYYDVFEEGRDVKLVSLINTFIPSCTYISHVISVSLNLSATGEWGVRINSTIWFGLRKKDNCHFSNSH